MTILSKDVDSYSICLLCDFPIGTLLWKVSQILSFITDREAGEIISLVASVCPFVLSCLNRLTYDLDFWHGDRP